MQGPAILHRHLKDDVPDVRLLRPTLTGNGVHARRSDRPRTGTHAGGALDWQAASQRGCSILALGTGAGYPGGGIGQGVRGWGRHVVLVALCGVALSTLSAISMALPRWEIASWKAERRSAWSPALPHHSIAASVMPACVK